MNQITRKTAKVITREQSDQVHKPGGSDPCQQVEAVFKKRNQNTISFSSVCASSVRKSGWQPGIPV